MKHHWYILCSFLLLFCMKTSAEEKKGSEKGETKKTEGKELSPFYLFKDRTIEGKEIDFSQFMGKKCLIVNTACNCGLAKKGFAAIRGIKEKHPEIEILLFPSALNGLIDQELSTAEEIIARMKENQVYDIATVFEKRVINSKEGLFKWLVKEGKTKSSIFDFMKVIKWNFTTFIVSDKGEYVDRIFPTNISVESIEKVLGSIDNNRNN